MIVFSSLIVSCRCADEALDVAHEEYGPRASLKKYEWFKDAAAALDAKVADIKIYEVRVNGLQEQYGDQPRSTWAREDREQYNINVAELAGLKASYNSLAADYNSQMSKINWSFAEVGKLPPGATKALPREYKPYVEK